MVYLQTQPNATADSLLGWKFLVILETPSPGVVIVPNLLLLQRTRILSMLFCTLIGTDLNCSSRRVELEPLHKLDLCNLDSGEERSVTETSLC